MDLLWISMNSTSHLQYSTTVTGYIKRSNDWYVGDKDWDMVYDRILGSWDPPLDILYRPPDPGVRKTRNF